jgi:hypothetical protein
MVEAGEPAPRELAIRRFDELAEAEVHELEAVVQAVFPRHDTRIGQSG